MKRSGIQEEVFSKRWVIILASTVCLVLILGVLWAIGFQQEQLSDPLVVSVNGEAVYASQIWSTYDRLPADMQEQYGPEVVLNQTIDQILVLQYAAEQGVVISDEQLQEAVDERMTFYGTTREELKELLEAQNETFEEFEQGIHDELVLDVFVSSVLLPSISIPDTQIQGYYQENIDEFTADPGEIRVRHILVSSEQEAIDLRQEALSGIDFSSLARAYSIDTAPRGGDLGFISQESPLVEPFKQTAFSLEQGEISEPVQTTFGWHIIKREDDRISLSDAREIIRERLRRERAQQQFATLLVDLKENATITYHRGANAFKN